MKLYAPFAHLSPQACVRIQLSRLLHQAYLQDGVICFASCSAKAGSQEVSLPTMDRVKPHVAVRKNRCTLNNFSLHVASLPQRQWHMSSFCQRKPSFIRLATDLLSVSQTSCRPKILQPSCCSIAAMLKTYCTPCTLIWAHVSGLPLSSDDFASNSSIQCRGLSTSRVAIQIQLY